jgi:hypothetical protein
MSKVAIICSTFLSINLWKIEAAMMIALQITRQMVQQLLTEPMQIAVLLVGGIETNVI